MSEQTEAPAFVDNFVPTHRDIEPDPRYNSKLATKFINCLMYDGKKSIATRAF